jgi:hypothetical protein
MRINLGLKLVYRIEGMNQVDAEAWARRQGGTFDLKKDASGFTVIINDSCRIAWIPEDGVTFMEIGTYIDRADFFLSGISIGVALMGIIFILLAM